MANKIISFGTNVNFLDSSQLSSSSSLSTLEVYRDISMESVFSGHTKPSYISEITHIANLVSAGKYDDAIQFIFTDSSDAVRQFFSAYFPTSEYNDNEHYEEKLRIWMLLSIWKIQKNMNVKAVFNSLHNIFTWTPGERILLPEFGSRLHNLLYEGITPQTEESIVSEIRACVSEWEPRVNIVSVRNVSTIDDTEDNTIHMEVVFTIPDLSDEQYTYSFSYTRST